MTATLCLLAFGAVMVYSASSPLGVLNGQGNGTGDFFRYVIFGALGLAAMHVLERRGLGAAGSAAREPAAARVLRAARARARAGLRGRHPRRPALVLGRADPVPALRADEDRARAVRRAVPGRPSQADARLPSGDGADRDRGRARVPADRRRARPGDGAGGRVHAGHAAARGGHAAALPGDPGGGGRGRGAPDGGRPALPAGAADLVPEPVGLEVDGRLPGGPGPDRAGLGRAARRRAGQVGAEDLLPARRRRRTSSWR